MASGINRQVELLVQAVIAIWIIRFQSIFTGMMCLKQDLAILICRGEGGSAGGR